MDLRFIANGTEDITQYPGYFSVTKDKVLKSVAVIGKNASGKTNVLYALNALVSSVVQYCRDAGSEPCRFFFFDQDTINKLTAFELLFEENNIRYLYRLALTKDEIYEESLSYAPNGRMVNLF